jgi:hypothetical protein
VSDVRATKAAKVYFCIGPSLSEPVGTAMQIKVVNAQHLVVFSRVAALPFANVVRIVPGRYVASIGSVDQLNTTPVVHQAAKASGRLPAGQAIYLMSGNSCPSKVS